LIYNGFGIYKTLKILKFCLENNIILYYLPSYTSYKLQPYNIGVFAPLKIAYYDQVKQLYQGGINIVNKEYFISLYSLAKEKVFTKKNIITV